MRDYLLVLGLGLITAYSPAFASEPHDEDGWEKRNPDDPALQSLANVEPKKIRAAGTDAFTSKEHGTKIPGHIGGGHFGD